MQDPPAGESRAATLVVIAATVFFAAVCSWELFGPILNGHYAANAGMGIIAENMLRWRIWGPVWEYTAAEPSSKLYYCHHPFGSFWHTALAMKIFGRHDFVCRLPAAVLSVATPPLLFVVGRRLWRPAAGAASALAFVVLPITLSFCQLNTLEVPVTAYGLVGLLGLLRHRETGRPRDALLSIAGFCLALHSDWPAYVLVAGVLAILGVRTFVLPRGFRGGGRMRDRDAGGYWAGLATVSVLTFAFYVGLFGHHDKLGDLLSVAKSRAAGSDQPLSAVVEARRYWIALSFTPLAVWIGKLGVPLFLARAAVKRDDRELLPLAWLAMASFQYVAFKQGADIHVFWPHPFAAYFALALGAFVATVAPFVDRRLPERGWAVALGIAALASLAILRDALPALPRARATGGRFDEKGVHIESDGAKTAFLAWASRPDAGVLRRASDPVTLTPSMRPTWAQVWALGGRVANLGGMDRTRPAFFDMREASAGEAEALRGARVVAAGPFWLVDPARDGALEGHRFVEREPTWWEAWLFGSTEPVRTIEPDPFVAWELAAHYRPATLAGFDRASVEDPGADEERLRVRHNLAVVEGDGARAAAILGELGAKLGQPAARFRNGTELVGVRFDRGAEPKLRLLFRASGAAGRGDVRVAVVSRVVEKATGSMVMADPSVSDVGPAAFPPFDRWKDGFLYSHVVPIRKRPGKEVFDLSLRRRGRTPMELEGGGPGEVRVLALP